MAGDILLYQADVVPIGDDQRQHLELARTIAERFNQRFGETFTVPRGVYPKEGARIRNLQEPERLMSTSRGAPQGVVRLVDPPDEIRRKFKTAVTDSGSRDRPRPEGQAGDLEPDRDPGRRQRRVDRTRSRRATKGRATASSSRTSAKPSSSCSAPYQERYRELRSDDAELLRMLGVGRARRRRGGASRRSTRCTSGWASPADRFPR